jgi:hypothetical protein
VEGEAASTSDVRIRIALQVKKMPRLRVETTLLVRAHPRLSLGDYRLPEDSRGPATEALRDTGGALTLVRGPSEDWFEFEDSADVSLPDLLLGSFKIIDDKGLALVRQPRRLAVFRKDTSLRYLIEIDRAELGSELALLVHRSLTAEVLRIIDACARPGFERLQGGSVSGVPEDWTLFSNVQLLIPPSDSATEEIAALIPVSWTSIAFAGGLALSGRSTWHVAHPPEVSVTSANDSDVVTASLNCLQAFGDSQPSEMTLGSLEGAAVFKLDELKLPEGDYEIQLSAGKGNGFLVRNTFRLRSATTFLPDAMTTRAWIGHRVGLDAWSCFSAEIDDVCPASFVRGAFVAGLEPHGGAGGDLPPQTLGATAAELEDDEDRPAEVRARSGSAMTCLLGGGHHWLIEPQTGGKHQRKTLRGYCKLCGLERSWPGTPKLKRAFRKPAGRPVIVVSQPAANLPTLRSDIRPISTTTTPDMDSLLDALSYMREGTWAAFEKLAVQVDDSPWFPLETARLLSALGHVDLVVNPKDLRIVMWAIAPPTFVVRGDGSAILAGFRSLAFVETIRQATERAGGDLVQSEVVGAPSVLSIEGFSEEELTRLAEMLSIWAPEAPTLATAPDAAILSNVAPLSALIGALPICSIPASCGLQRFDIATGKWRDVSVAAEPGGYRLLLHPIRYGFISSADLAASRMRLADNRLVKYLAALDSNASLIAYDSASGRVRVHLGAQLPGLFERALVLATGIPPRKLVDGTVEYEGIDENSARRLWTLVGRSDGRGR